MPEQKPDFAGFIEEFSRYMQDNHPALCFYGFGSCFQNQSYHPIDIDGGVIVPGIITDKQEILKLSRNLYLFLQKYEISQIQLNLIDCQSARDGRFLSYTTDYTDYIKRKGVVLAGPNLFPCLNGLDFRIGVLESMSFNFRDIRNKFLLDSHFAFQLDYKPEDVEEIVDRARKKTESLPKKLVQLKTGEIVENKYEAVRRLAEFLPGLDLTLFSMLRALRDRENLEQLLQNPQETFDFLCQALTTFESLIKAYIETFPPRIISVKTQI